MSLKSFSAFIYGHHVVDSNQIINFSEGSGELVAIIPIGSYTLERFIEVVSSALNDAGGNDYTVSVDRMTRRITVSSTGNFDLLVETGSNPNFNAFELMGFTTERSGGSSYVADAPTGKLFEPQFKLQQYVDFDDFVDASDSSVNTSASGVVEVISFGENNYMECNIKYATDILGQGAIKNNASGVSDLREFMRYATKKRPLEFVPDIENPSVFVPCVLEKTRASSNGTGFQLYEMYSRGLANYFETQLITFRKV